MKEIKQRNQECKKTSCTHYKERWTLGGYDIKYCMECKWAYRSQYTNKEEESKGIECKIKLKGG